MPSISSGSFTSDFKAHPMFPPVSIIASVILSRAVGMVIFIGPPAPRVSALPSSCDSNS